MDISLNKLQERVEDRETWCTAVHEVAELDTTECLNKKILARIGSRNLHIKVNFRATERENSFLFSTK